MTDGPKNVVTSTQGGLEGWLELVGRTGEAPGHSPVYRMRLSGHVPDDLRAVAKDNRPSDKNRGREILDGVWRFGSTKIETPSGHSPWGPPFPTPHFADRIHRFEWLRDVAALGAEGEAHARALVVAWVERYGKWEAFAWRSAVTADRIINWISAGPWLLGELRGKAQEDFLDSLARQVRHLHASGEADPDPLARFRVGVALTLAGAALDFSDILSDGLASLERECAAQILADGGHIGRAPETLANVLHDIQAVDDLLLRLGHQAPAFLTRLQPRMAAMLSFFTLPNGELLPANGGGAGRPGLAQSALQTAGAAAAKFSFARLSGYQRVIAKNLTLYMDSGEAPPKNQGGRAAAGVLAIHVSDGAETIFTSCAAHSDLEPALRDAARRTAAHTVLGLSQTDSADFVVDAETGMTAPVGPVEISARRLEENDQYLLEGQHSGWREKTGLIYRRRLFVDRDGNRITGEDSLSRPLSSDPETTEAQISAELRFHIHPDVEIIRDGEDNTVFLGLPLSQSVWRFRSEVVLSVEKSRYWGGGTSRLSNQLVLKTVANSLGDGSKMPNRIRWALSRAG